VDSSRIISGWFTACAHGHVNRQPFWDRKELGNRSSVRTVTGRPPREQIHQCSLVARTSRCAPEDQASEPHDPNEEGHEENDQINQ
jgi:hypothetical protein